MCTNHTLNEWGYILAVKLEHQFLFSNELIINNVRSITSQLQNAILFNVKKRGKTALLLMHWWLETNLKLIFSTKQKPFSICYKRSTRNCIPYWQLSFFPTFTEMEVNCKLCPDFILAFSTKNHFSTKRKQLQLFHELFDHAE